MYHGHCPACAKKIQRERGIEGKRRSRERKRQVCIELSAKNDRLAWNSVKVVWNVRAICFLKWRFTAM